jgi:hypothetical protein
MVTDTIRGKAFAQLLKGFFNGVEGGFDLQHVLAGFHQHQVHTTVNQSPRLLHVGGFEGVEVDVAQGGQLGAWPHGTSHEAGLFGVE